MLPIVLISLAYVLGIIGGLYNICIALFCLIICLVLIKNKRNIIIISCIFFICGFFLTKLRLNNYDNKYTSGTINVEAKVISSVIEKENVNSYIIKNKYGDKFILYVDKNKNIEYGTKIVLNGSFELPALSRNRRWI